MAMDGVWEFYHECTKHQARISIYEFYERLEDLQYMSQVGLSIRFSACPFGVEARLDSGFA